MFMSILATVQLVCVQLLSTALGFEADASTSATANGSVSEATATQPTLVPRPTGVSTTPPPSLPLGYLPHIVFFLADDWGHFNMGWRGNPEARTPNIDGLVQDGIVLDRHYVFQFCSPTRSSLLSGRLPIHINTKNMGPTALGGVDLRASTIADKLRSAGYRTHQVPHLSRSYHLQAGKHPPVVTSALALTVRWASGMRARYSTGRYGAHIPARLPLMRFAVEAYRAA
jgi:hypothetical protein